MQSTIKAKELGTTVTIAEEVTGHVTITSTVREINRTVTVSATDLAEALVTASPTFSTGLAEIMQRAILSSIGREN